MQDGGRALGGGEPPVAPSRIVRMNPIAVILVKRVTRYKNWIRDTFLTDNADLSWLAERGTGHRDIVKPAGRPWACPMGVGDGWKTASRGAARRPRFPIISLPIGHSGFGWCMLCVSLGASLSQHDDGARDAACGLLLLERPARPLSAPDLSSPEARCALRSFGGHGRLHACRVLEVSGLVDLVGDHFHALRHRSFKMYTVFKHVDPLALRGVLEIPQAVPSKR